MISLNSYLEKRMLQQEQHVMMIGRYLEIPDRFMPGTVRYTKDMQLEAQNDGVKCRALLRFLKELEKLPPGASEITVKIRKEKMLRGREAGIVIYGK